MIFPFKSRKKDSDKHLEPSISPIFEESLDEPRPLPAATNLSIKEYAAAHGLREGEVWRRIKRGELTGRPIDGELCIEPSARSDDMPRPKKTLDHSTRESPRPPSASPLLAKKSVLPPVPESDHQQESGPKDGDRKGAQSDWPPAAVAAATANASTELALLIDHLSLSKDENREILRLAQESIRKITELSDTLVAMKDAVIEAKTTQIDSLKELLTLRDKEIKTLQKSNEDLDILARTMSRQVSADQNL